MTATRPVRIIRNFLSRGDQAPTTPPPALNAVPTTWDNAGLAVERAMQIFLPAATTAPGVTAVRAKSSGPSVHFLVTVVGPWEDVIDHIEERLFHVAKAGDLPPLTYDVQEPGYVEPGYLTVYSG